VFGLLQEFARQPFALRCRLSPLRRAIRSPLHGFRP